MLSLLKENDFEIYPLIHSRDPNKEEKSSNYLLFKILINKNEENVKYFENYETIEKYGKEIEKNQENSIFIPEGKYLFSLI